MEKHFIDEKIEHLIDERLKPIKEEIDTLKKLFTLMRGHINDVNDRCMDIYKKVVETQKDLQSIMKIIAKHNQ